MRFSNIISLAKAMLLIPTAIYSIPVGSGRYTFADFPSQDWEVPVWTYRPAHAGTDAPIVFVCHGLNRDAESYRNSWILHAERLGFLLVVAEFTTQSFPGSRSYNQGNLFATNGSANPQEQWSFNVIERIFDDVVAKTSSTRQSYHLYGHSAGAQFVHRMVMLMPYIRVERAVSANAGWYTIPDPNINYPYGLGNSPYHAALVNERLRQNHLVLLGTADNNPDDPSLNRSPETDVQGIHRFERGNFFFDAATAYASANGVEFGWSLGYAHGVGHSNSAMAPYAANWLIHPWYAVGVTLHNRGGISLPEVLDTPVVTYDTNSSIWTVSLLWQPVGIYYHLQHSSNLTDWKEVTSTLPVADRSGVHWKIDPPTTSAYFRIVANPP
jgi:hypothetical protein